MIIAIDQGYRNFSWVQVDATHWVTPLRWEHEDWWVGRSGVPTINKLRGFMHEWMVRNKDALEAADKIVLEIQMKKKFSAMNAMVAGRYWDKVVYVSPKTISSFWKLSSYREQKKADAIERVKGFAVRFPDVKCKKDDLADAWLLAVRELIQQGHLDISNFSEYKKT